MCDEKEREKPRNTDAGQQTQECEPESGQRLVSLA